MLKFSSRMLTKSAASNAVITEAKNRYGKKPNFPQDEEGVRALFEILDEMVPKGAQSQGPGKQMYLFLLKQLYGVNPPGWVLNEDEYKVKPLMENYWKAISKKILRGDAANLDGYRNLEDLRDAVSIKDEEEDSGEHQNLYSERELGVIAKGAKVIYDTAPWKVYKVPKGTSPKGYEAAKTLCDNSKHGVSWCVGRGMASTYVPQGDFFVLERNGRSVYAISSDSRSMTLWNPADTPIFSSAGGGDKASQIPSLEAASAKTGVQFDMGTLSALPADIRPILAALHKSEPVFKAFLPESQLQETVDKTPLRKILHAVDPVAFINDLNELYQDRSSYIQAHALLSEAISDDVHMKIPKEGFDAMTLYTLTGYMEALAGKGEKRIPDELDQVLIPLVDQWDNQR